MKSLKMNVRTMMKTMMVAAIAFVSLNATAQTKTELADEFLRLSTKSDEIYDRYAREFEGEDFYQNDGESIELSEEEMAEIEKEFGEMTSEETGEGFEEMTEEEIEAELNKISESEWAEMERELEKAAEGIEPNSIEDTEEMEPEFDEMTEDEIAAEVDKISESEWAEIEREFEAAAEGIDSNSLNEEDVDPNFEEAVEQTEAERIAEFVSFYEQENGRKSLDEILSSLKKKERKEMRKLKGEDRENLTKMFELERELARIEYKMYQVGKQYLAR